ncbi:hypothetical protein HN51_012257, partial [Arachis hypogaea]
ICSSHPLCRNLHTLNASLLLRFATSHPLSQPSIDVGPSAFPPSIGAVYRYLSRTRCSTLE